MPEARGVFVIAEAGSNWRAGSPERDLARSYELVDIAAAAGADAVKFQTYRARDTYVPDAGSSDYLAERGIRRSINDVFAELEMPYDLVGRISEYSAEAGIEFMSTAFSVRDAEAIDPHVVRHKVASYEINHVRLLQWLAATGKPLIMSTGAATGDDIEFALGVVRAAGGSDITLLQCTASYPAPVASLNLRAILTMHERYGVPTGLSDHSEDPLIAPIGAVALGATVIEKHFTVDRRLPGPDHAFALEPEALEMMVRAIRQAAEAEGDGVKRVDPAEIELRDFAVRAIQATRHISEGEELVEGANIDVLRPGKRPKGMHPRYLDDLKGRRASRPIMAGNGIQPEDLNPPIA